MLIDTDLEKDITRRLMAALQQDEFLLYAQSIIPLVPQRQDLPFQEIYVRFREEDAKLLPPGTFFPVLEECHMLPYLDRWVVNRLARWVRAGLNARVSTHDQQTLPMQLRSMREYAARRGWNIALQVKEVGSGASKRQMRDKLMEAAPRREVNPVLVWRLDRCDLTPRIRPIWNTIWTDSGGQVTGEDR